MNETSWDVVIVGGGPGGATAGWFLTHHGLRAIIIEKEEFPRYCVGESLLPYSLALFREMGFLPTMEREGFLKKFGALFGDSRAENVTRIQFADGLQPEFFYSYQVQRDRFDQLLLEHARSAGTAHLQACAEELLFDDGGERVVGVVAKDKAGQRHRLRARLVIDASGRAAFVGRKLRLMEPDPRLDTASVFTLYEGLPIPRDSQLGDPLVLTFPEGWFWLIPFSDGRFSVGVVVDRPTYDDFPERSLEKFFDAMVARADGRVAEALAPGRRCADLHVLRKFARSAKSFAGPGWVLVGDAAMFIDPVFAAGVYVAAIEAKMAVLEALVPLKAGEPVDAHHFESYIRNAKGGYEVFARFIYSWQDPAFRKFFFGGSNKVRPRPIVQTITTILAGGVFDRELIQRGESLFFHFAEREGSRALLADDKPPG